MRVVQLRRAGHCVLAGILILVLMIAARAAAEDTPEPADGDDPPGAAHMAELEVVLTDGEGRPVVGAEVMPYAMRMIEDQGHGYWNEKLFGPPRRHASNEAGVAVIRYPARVPAGPRMLTTRLVTFSINHPEFISQVVDFDLGPERATVTLEAGCEVQLSAVDTERTPIEEFCVVMAGPYEPERWSPTEAGGRRTRSVKPGTWQTMLVKLQEDGPTLFSGVLPLRVRPEQTVRVNNVALTPGARVRGRLSADVPRPTQGYVISLSVPKPAENSWNDTNPSLIWYDWTEVAEDGTFEFESLPRGGQVQLIAVCDGWISSTTVPDAQIFVMGQLFDVDEEVVNVELAMEPTGTLEVAVVTEDGKPVTEGTVSCSPNQRYFKGGSTALGQRFRSATILQNQLLPPGERKFRYERNKEFPFMGKLGPDGTVVLTGIPCGQSFSLALYHDRLTFSSDNDPNGREYIRFTLPTATPVPLKATAVAASKPKP